MCFMSQSSYPCTALFLVSNFASRILELALCDITLGTVTNLAFQEKKKESKVVFVYKNARAAAETALMMMTFSGIPFEMGQGQIVT